MSEQNQSDPTGKAADTTVVVSRVVSGSLKETWARLVTAEGAEVILGEGGVLGDKGDSWRATDGSRGVIRTFHRLEQIRFTWQQSRDDPASLVDIKVRPNGDAETVIDLKVTNLTADADVDAVKAKWEQVLAAF